MIKGENKKIIMTEGDFGIVLPIKITGAVFENNDIVKFSIINVDTCKTIIEKLYTKIANNKIDFYLTEEESKLLKEKDYSFSIDWYRDKKFLCNIINNGILNVESKC